MPIAKRTCRLPLQHRDRRPHDRPVPRGSGLNAEITTIEHRENNPKGLPVLKKLPGARKYGDITLKRGLTDPMTSGSG